MFVFDVPTHMFSNKRTFQRLFYSHFTSVRRVNTNTLSMEEAGLFFSGISIEITSMSF